MTAPRPRVSKSRGDCPELAVTMAHGCLYRIIALLQSMHRTAPDRLSQQNSASVGLIHQMCELMHAGKGKQRLHCWLRLRRSITYFSLTKTWHPGYEVGGWSAAAQV